MWLHLYLAPHLDDAVLSCGGLIAHQARAGDSVVVLTVFAGDPPVGPASPFAAYLAQVWQTPENPAAVRRAEDRAAVGLLGASWLHWEYPDCIFRHHPESGEGLYPTREAIFGEVHPSERTALVDELAGRLAALCTALRPTTVCSLLTVGHHVDHQILQRASRQCETADRPLRYYEDYPYVENPAWLEAALAEGGAWRPELVTLSAADLEAKIGAVACYRSQLGGLFGDEEGMRGRVRAYAHSLGVEGPAERYWQPQATGQVGW